MKKAILAAALVTGALAGCVGSIGDGGEGGDPSTSSQSACTPIVPVGPLRRLTREQYDRTVRDLLGVEQVDAFAADDVVDGFDVGGTVSPLLEEQHVAAAEAIAAKIDAEKVCAGDCVATFLRRAFRRPATADELARYSALLAKGATHADGVRLVVTAALLSPSFHYLRDIPAERALAGATVDLDDHALASRLSYFLWGTMPDDALLDAADAGELHTPEQLAAAARRMVKDAKAKDAIASFHRQWLHLDAFDGMARDEKTYPEWDPSLRASMRTSLELFVTDAATMGRGGVDALLGGTHAFVDGKLAQLWGVTGVTGDAMVRVELDPKQRKGLVTQPALMALLAKADESDPVHRGVFVRRQLLCQDLPPPPPDVKLEIPPPAAGKSTRERFAEHRKNPTCASCHDMIDGVGFGLEGYDALGRFRTMDQGVAIDSSGKVVGTEDADGAFSGGAELATKLAQSSEVRRCIARKWTTFALQRAFTEGDRCGVDALGKALVASGGDLPELMVAITQLDAFRKVTIEKEAP